MKIFGIGLNKTGITSLSYALRMLEFKIVQCSFDPELVEKTINSNKYNINQFKVKLIDEIDGLTDIQSCILYKQFDHCYPESKFILTTRNKEEWLESCYMVYDIKQKIYDKTIIGKIVSPTFQKLRYAFYGCDYDREKWGDIYDKYHQNVFDYFKNRLNDLLVIDVNLSDNEKWKKMCNFLNKKILHIKYPKLNVTKVDFLRNFNKINIDKKNINYKKMKKYYNL